MAVIPCPYHEAGVNFPKKALRKSYFMRVKRISFLVVHVLEVLAEIFLNVYESGFG